MPDLKFDGEQEHFACSHDDPEFELKIRTYWMNGRPQLDIRWFQRFHTVSGGRFWQPTRKGLRVPFDMLTLVEKGLSMVPKDLEEPDDR